MSDELPAGFVLPVVVAAADGVEIFGVGFPALFPGDGVFEVAVAGLAVAVGIAAGAVSRDHVLGKILGRTVGGAAVVEEVTAFVGDQPPQVPVSSAAMRRATAAGIGPEPASSPGCSSRPSSVDNATVT
jgi:hypothetical protein